MSGNDLKQEIQKLRLQLEEEKKTGRRLAAALKNERMSQERMLSEFRRIQKRSDRPFILSAEYQSMKKQEEDLRREVDLVRAELEDLRLSHSLLQGSYERLSRRLAGRKDALARREALIRMIRKYESDPDCGCAADMAADAAEGDGRPDGGKEPAWVSLGMSRATYYRYRKELKSLKAPDDGSNASLHRSSIKEK